MQNEDDAVEASTSRLEKPGPMDTSPLRKELPDNDAVGIEDNLNGIPAASNAAGGQVAALSEKADLDQAASRDQGGDGVSALAKDSSGHAAKEVEQTASEHRVDSEERGRTRDESRSKDRKQKSRERDRGREREKDREKERSRSSRKDKDRDRDRDRKDSKRAKGDDRDGSRDRRDSKKSRRSRSREKSRRRDSRDRRSSRRSPSGHRRRSRSRGRRRSSSRDRNRRRSYSRERGFRGRRRSFGSDSDDGFGGYVPRKRQEAPQAAAGFSTAFVDPYAALRSKQPLPTDPEGIKREMAEQQLRARQMVLQQQAASAVAAASKTQREIYVGNLVQGLVTEDALRQLFNSTMKAAFPEQQIPGMDPVVTVSMHSEGRYAFVELRTPDMASAALQLSGQVQLLGQSISVGRPSGYVDPSAAQMAAAQAATALSSFELGQSTLQEATEAMNTISMPGVSASQPPGASPSPQAPLALPAPPPLATTPYLQIVGMVTAEVLADDEEYSEVIEDIQEECGKYGKILSILVPRPSNPATSAQVFGQGNYGKAFVHFEDAKSCQQSKDAVHGRLFAGVSLQASFISEKEFQDSKVSD